MFKKILFPVDLSEASTKIAPYVSEMAAKFGSEIHIIFVARVMEQYAGLYVPHPAIKTFEAEIVRGAERKLSEFLENIFPRQQVIAKVVPGDPAEEILSYANQQKIELIIMGTHGRKGLERIFFGSVAEQVIKKAAAPVLSVNPYRPAAQ